MSQKGPVSKPNKEPQLLEAAQSRMSNPDSSLSVESK